MPTIILVRHGVTDATGSRLGGHTDASLNDAGKTQAETTAARLSELAIATVYSSPIVRTRETAVILGKPHGLFPKTARGLIEVDYGDWTDRPLSECRTEPLWRTIQQAPSRVTFPGGGSIRGMQAQAVDSIESIAAQHGDDEIVLAVSHADVIKAILAHLLGLGLDGFQRIVVGPASSSVVYLPLGGAPTVLSMNDYGPIDLPTRAAAQDDSDTVGADDDDAGQGVDTEEDR
ncbi:MAG: putative phosphomutase (TIGR03848 family) [Myxococcota bacterium]|jgi:probable phosphomutase (TIGR03848 family)